MRECLPVRVMNEWFLICRSGMSRKFCATAPLTAGQDRFWLGNCNEVTFSFFISGSQFFFLKCFKWWRNLFQTVGSPRCDLKPIAKDTAARWSCTFAAPTPLFLTSLDSPSSAFNFLNTVWHLQLNVWFFFSLIIIIRNIISGVTSASVSGGVMELAAVLWHRRWQSGVMPAWEASSRALAKHVRHAGERLQCD